jgi:uncharacterized protein (TIGR02217 family)
MSNAVLPALVGLNYPVIKTPRWSTKVQTTVSGKETRLNLWSYPIWEYTLGYDVLRSDAVNLELQQLVAFYNARSGSYDDWLFNDPDDNTATNQSFGTGDGTTTAFQLQRAYGGYVEPVRGINAISSVNVNGTTTAAYTVSATGLLTFTTAPAASAALRWSGTYYWRVRFMDDHIDLNKFANQFWELKTLRFTSCK